jgi:UDP-N-acetylglucosamine--N-acetylmuramyl-(pentapeptide) pyrophosphoryl-undecaprenol N-acetylglucosamine transferase
MKKTICGVAGASGGHIIPGIIYLQASAQKEDAQVLFFSSDARFDQSILRHYSTVFSYYALPNTRVPGKKFWCYPLFIYRSLQALFMSFRALRRYKPQRVVSMGGFISLPVCLAARVLGIEVHIFELNAVPGKAARWLAPYTQKAFVCFPQAARFFDEHKVQLVPYPLRFSVDDMLTQEDARARLGISLHKKVLLVIGGSQGSQALNSIVQKFFEVTGDKDIAVIHQTGGTEQTKKAFEDFYQQKRIEAVVFEYVHELNICYSAADLVISRAGAGSLFELEFFKKKSIIVPLEEAAEGHQLQNAESMMQQHPKLFFLARQSDIEHHKVFLHSMIAQVIGQKN